MYPYTGITFIVCCVIAYKVLRRLYAWNDAAIKRRDAQRKIRELDAAIRLHVRRVFDKYEQNITKTAAALKVSRNTVRKYS